MCGKCVPYCPMGCIVERDGSMDIDLDECVECGICKRDVGCPTDAFEAPPLEMPRFIRGAFSNPFVRHKNQEGGRGTEEVKTNDVTGVVNSLDKVEIGIEMGRPSLGARFRDVEIMTKVVSKFDITFADHNPMTALIVNKKTGEIDPTVLDEKVLSCIIEFEAHTHDLPNILDAIRDASRQLVNTVFSLCVICKVDENDNTIVETEVVKKGFGIHAASSKTNLGLGRPRYEDRVKGGAPQ